METFVKHFCRLLVEQELSNEDVAEYYDIVQSVIPAKVVVAYTDDDKVEAKVMAYDADNGYIYEIILSEQISLDEGENISDILAEEFDIDFEFETSMEI